MSQRTSIDTSRLVSEIKRGFSSAPGQLNEREFDQLSENIANAIGRALEEYDRGLRSPEPDFGEEERVADH